ncbi:histidine phosphatase family protein [Streptomyces sp. NPDC001941]|uniref:SixA phosphatase family protein n=1 Tax=Streptomyces sp. NPDC001941 TaxID=3154659 RepID=UPI00332C3877
MKPLRRLVAVRHAKAVRRAGIEDPVRPLTANGRKDAEALGRWLYGGNWLPDLVLCSPARRAHETWELIASRLGSPPPVVDERRVYRAGPAELLALTRQVPPHVGTLAVVGHNPGVRELVLALAGDGEGGALRRVRAAVPTASAAVLTWRGDWEMLGAGSTLLSEFVVGHELRPRR